MTTCLHGEKTLFLSTEEVIHGQSFSHSRQMEQFSVPLAGNCVINLNLNYMGASLEYPLGTDQLGRCELSLLFGARYSLGMSLPAILVLSVIGLLLGSYSECAGKWADRVLIMICDVFIAFLALLIAAAIIGVGRDYIIAARISQDDAYTTTINDRGMQTRYVEFNLP